MDLVSPFFHGLLNNLDFEEEVELRNGQTIEIRYFTTDQPYGPILPLKIDIQNLEYKEFVDLLRLIFSPQQCITGKGFLLSF